jgi:hypothetical protein
MRHLAMSLAAVSIALWQQDSNRRAAMPGPFLLPFLLGAEQRWSRPAMRASLNNCRPQNNSRGYRLVKGVALNR